MNRSNHASVSLVLAFIAAGCYAQSESTQISFAPAEPHVITVMTYNIRVANIMDILDSWSFRKKHIFNVITDHAPDIFGLQEPLRNQFEHVQAAFPQYDGYYVGGGDGKRSGESCPIFYRKDRFDLVASGTFWFSDNPDKAGSKGWGNIPPRFCSWVQLSEKGQSSSFYVYNMHLDSVSQNSCDKSVRLLEKRIAANQTPAPYIIMGDFNMKLQNQAMAFLLTSGPENKFPVIDSWLSVNPDKPNMSTCNFGIFAKGPQIDYILVDPAIKPLDIKIDDRKVNGHYPSDHFPVVAKLELPAPAGQHVATAK